MNRWTRAAAVIAATGLLVALTAHEADAGDPPSTRIEAKISKHVDGPFK